MTMPAPRILPVTILAALLLLSVRAGNLWTESGLAKPAIAQTAQRVRLAAGGDAPRDTAAGGSEQAEAARKPDSEPMDAATVPLSGAELPLPDLDGTTGYSAEEVEVLSELSRRRESLEQREAELALREGLLQAAEKRIEARVAELTALRSDIEGLLRHHDEQEEAELRSLVKIYETMKPKDAARILAGLDMPVLLQIMSRMKEKSSAPLLAAMPPDRARELTADLAQRRELGAPDD